MDWGTKMNNLNGNPVTQAGQIGYLPQQLLSKIILGDMHPIGQILNFNDRGEFQSRVMEHMHAPIHVVDAP